MLEFRYDKATGNLTGWWYNRLGDNVTRLRNRPNEALGLLDVDIPKGNLGVPGQVRYDIENNVIVTNLDLEED